MVAPAGGENPLGFHPCFRSISDSLYSHPRFWPRISRVFITAFVPSPILAEIAAAWQAYHPLMAAVLTLRVRNAAIRGCSACRDDAGLGRDE
jgi:hypothetical protein